MLAGDVFLDTCIILSRAIGRDLEGSAGDCDRIICSSASLHTGSAVVEELKDVTKRRELLYRMLIAHILTGAEPRAFDMSHMMDNDSRHFRAILKLMDRMGDKAARSKYVTQLNLRIKTSCQDSLSRANVTSLELPGGPYFVDTLRGMGIIGPDARIILQYVSWGKGRALSSFVSNDGDHILSNRDHILDTAYMQFSFPHENMHILHSREAVLLINGKP